jgi:hypothetical protein
MEHFVLDDSQGRRRLDPQLVDEPAPKFAVQPQGVDMATATGE